MESLSYKTDTYIINDSRTILVVFQYTLLIVKVPNIRIPNVNYKFSVLTVLYIGTRLLYFIYIPI